MAVVTVSSQFQVVIPKEIREQLGLRPGQKVEAFAVGGRIELVPLEPIEGLRGFLKGTENSFRREEDRL